MTIQINTPSNAVVIAKSLKSEKIATDFWLKETLDQSLLCWKHHSWRFVKTGAHIGADQKTWRNWSLGLSWWSCNVFICLDLFLCVFTAIERSASDFQTQDKSFAWCVSLRMQPHTISVAPWLIHFFFTSGFRLYLDWVPGNQWESLLRFAEACFLQSWRSTRDLGE